MNAPDSSPPLEASAKARSSVFVVLSLITAGLSLTERVSHILLPLTLRRFTEDATIIGCILALNPMFGFIAQPLVGVLSDRIWTPIGRRAFFLMLGAPVVAICLLMIPETTMLWQLVIVVAVFQFFQDVLWGSDHPLIADLVPPQQRTLLRACTTTSGELMGFIFLQFGMGWAMERFGEASLYRFAAIAQVAFVMIAALFLKERRLPRRSRPKLTVPRYISDLLGNPVLRRFAILAFTQAIFLNIVSGFAVLFAVYTIGLSRGDFGEIWSVQAVITLVCAIPLGLFAYRISKPRVLVLGYVLVLAACVFGFFATDAASFSNVAVLFGLGSVLLDVTLRPFFTEFLPSDLIGQLMGAFNICSAVGRSVALAGGGWLVHTFGNDYQVIWVVAFIAGIASVIIAASLAYVRGTTD